MLRRHALADTAGQPDDVARAVPDRRDAVKGALDAGPIIIAELADARYHVLEIVLGDSIGA